MTVSDTTCTEGDVRVIDGTSEYEGRVEVCNGGQFGPVCDNKWTDADAQVVCGHLGYPTTGVIIYNLI